MSVHVSPWCEFMDESRISDGADKSCGNAGHGERMSEPIPIHHIACGIGIEVVPEISNLQR